MDIKYTLFDADGTLFDYEHAEMQAFINTLTTFHIKGDIDELHASYKVINYAIWKDFEDHKISAADLRVERFRRFLDKRQLHHDPEEVSKCYISHLAQGTVLIKGADEIIEYLRNRYSISIITNGLADVQYARINKSVLNGYFDNIFISEEIGYPKPMKEIFEHVFEVLGNPDKKEVIIIGDSFRSDIVGGRNYGIKTCWYNPKNIENQNGFEADYEIKELKELERIL